MFYLVAFTLGQNTETKPPYIFFFTKLSTRCIEDAQNILTQHIVLSSFDGKLWIDETGKTTKSCDQVDAWSTVSDQKHTHLKT